MSEVTETTDTKVIYLIKRRATTSRDELVAHWYANHMPPVIDVQAKQRAAGAAYASKYWVTLFDDPAGLWDGMAHLWWTTPISKPSVPHGTEPRDSFHERVEPYWSWSTREYVVLDGGEHLGAEPLTLNAPYPMTRSGFFKVTFLVTPKPGIDFARLFDHWLNVHVPNVSQCMTTVGGFRYVVSHSIDPSNETYAGMAELYFPAAEQWADYRRTIRDDGMGEWIDRATMPIFTADTEMVGIP